MANDPAVNPESSRAVPATMCVSFIIPVYTLEGRGMAAQFGASSSSGGLAVTTRTVLLPVRAGSTG